MKIMMFSLMSLAMASFGQEATPADNPGHLDSPACLALVKKVLTDNNAVLDTLIIEYCGTNMTSDHKGASNSYLVRNKQSGKAMKVTVGVIWEPVQQASVKSENGD